MEPIQRWLWMQAASWKRGHAGGQSPSENLNACSLYKPHGGPEPRPSAGSRLQLSATHRGPVQ